MRNDNASVEKLNEISNKDYNKAKLGVFRRAGLSLPYDNDYLNYLNLPPSPHTKEHMLFRLRLKFGSLKPTFQVLVRNSEEEISCYILATRKATEKVKD